MTQRLSNARPVEILFAEDNDDDFELTRIEFERTRLALHLHRVRDGEECMAFLRREGRYADAPAPDMLLLDLNMPRMGGREVLAEIAADDTLRHLPVVILTTSDNQADILAMYRLRCSAYVVKPIDFEQFRRVVKTITDYWFTVVALPVKRGP